MLFEGEGENSPSDDAPFIAGEDITPAPVTQAAEQTPAAIDTPAPVTTTPEPANDEATARQRGWVPKEEFRGDPAMWQDAKSFNGRNAAQDAEIRELRTALEETKRETKAELDRIARTAEKTIQRERERAFQELDDQKRAAVDMADTDEYDRVVAEETRLYDQFRQEDAPPAPKTQAPPDAAPLLPETAAWIEKNPWFNTNPSMNKVALGFYDEAMERHTVEADRLKWVDTRLAQVYPDRFKPALPNTPMPSLEGGGRQPASSASRAGELPADARAAAERFIKKGYVTNMDEYAKMYFEQN